MRFSISLCGVPCSEVFTNQLSIAAQFASHQEYVVVDTLEVAKLETLNHDLTASLATAQATIAEIESQKTIAVRIAQENRDTVYSLRLKSDIAAELAHRDSELESLRKQLSDRSDDYFRSRNEVVAYCEKTLTLNQQIAQRLQNEHVLRETLQQIVDSGVLYSSYNMHEEEITASSRLNKLAYQALSTPTISGLVVCKDEPIYQYRRKGNLSADSWITVSKLVYDRVIEEETRIVYEKSEL